MFVAVQTVKRCSVSRVAPIWCNEMNNKPLLMRRKRPLAAALPHVLVVSEEEKEEETLQLIGFTDILLVA